MANYDDGMADAMAYEIVRRNLKRQKKTQKKFVVSLLNSAASSDWEDHEIAKLMCLLAENMGLSNKKLLRLLNKTSLLSTELIACLSDNGVNIKARDIMKHLKKTSNSVQSLLSNLDKCLEQGVLCSHDVGVLAEIREYVELEKISHSDLTSIVATFCSHADSLRQCGTILNTFCDSMLTASALSLAQDVMSMEFVHSLDGIVDDFFEELSALGQQFEESLRDVLEVNQYGELMPADSDADEEGNLRGFVEDDDVIRYDSDSADYQVHSEHSLTSSDDEESSDNDFSSSSSTEELPYSCVTASVPVSAGTSKRARSRADSTNDEGIVSTAALSTARPVRASPSRSPSPSDEEEEFDIVIPTKSRRSNTARSSKIQKKQRISRRVIIDESDSDD